MYAIYVFRTSQYDIPRDRLIILTKCYGLVANTPNIMTYLHPNLKTERDYINQYGLSRAANFNAVDASLQRLETPYIDLCVILELTVLGRRHPHFSHSASRSHRFDANTPIEETMKALHDLVQLGKVRYIGASSMCAWQFACINHVAEKNGWTKFVSM